MERLTIPDEPIGGGTRRMVIDARAVREEAMTVYWRLKLYEDTGLTPEQLGEMDRLYLEKCQEVAELGKRMGWIPVEERLPEGGQEVMVTCRRSGGDYVTHDEYDWDYCAWASDAGNITAWMPMPEPYRPGEQHLPGR